MSKRALWATSTASPANSRKRRTASCAGGAPRSDRGSIPVSLAIGGGRGRRGFDERLEPLLELEPAHPHGADLADRRAAGREPRRLEIDDDVRGELDRELRTGRIGQADVRAPPGKARVPLDDVGKELAREAGRRLPERVEVARSVLRRNGAAPKLDELDEAVRGVERELHAGKPRRTYVRMQGQKEGRAARGPREAFGGGSIGSSTPSRTTARRGRRHRP